MHLERVRDRHRAIWCASRSRPPGPRRGCRPHPGHPAARRTLIVRVDPQRFAQVVDNLVSNAVKYTPAGGRVEVDLSVTRRPVELVVLDTGIGISMRDRNHVFSRFFRAQQAARKSIQGIGLGLSITKAIVDSHGGRIEVESEEGRGSTFRVWLPLDLTEPAPRPAARPRGSARPDGRDRASSSRGRCRRSPGCG